MQRKRAHPDRIRPNLLNKIGGILLLKNPPNGRESGSIQHNVIPDKCTMLVDIRTNEFYDNEEVFEFIRQHLKSEVKAHSFRLKSSRIDPAHPLIKKCVAMGMKPFGSPTLSDQALMHFPSFKLGPGESSRSHSADEFIKISEISDAVAKYRELLDGASI